MSNTKVGYGVTSVLWLRSGSARTLGDLTSSWRSVDPGPAGYYMACLCPRKPLDVQCLLSTPACQLPMVGRPSAHTRIAPSRPQAGKAGTDRERYGVYRGPHPIQGSLAAKLHPHRHGAVTH